MAQENKFKAHKFARSLSELSSTSQFLDPNSFIEVYDRIEGKSKKTTLGAIDQSVITTYQLYNHLNEVFNPLEHPNETYFPEPVTFFEHHNPFIHEENNKPLHDESNLFDSLRDNNLVTKQAVDDYLKNTGICVPVCSPDSNYIYYIHDEHLWKMDNSKKPIVMDYHKDGIWTSESKLKFHYGTNYYYYTDEVVSPKNIMLNVTGNIVLNIPANEYNDDWFEKQHYFVGLSLNGKIATFTFLKNILKIENTLRENDYYVVAQFHFVCPIAKGTIFRIITNANCRLFGISDKDQYSRKLYDSLNAVNLGYYDYYGDDIAVTYIEKEATGLPIEPYLPPTKPPVLPEFSRKKYYIVQKKWNDGGYEYKRPSKVYAKFKVADKTIANVEVSEFSNPEWESKVTMKMPIDTDIIADFEEDKYGLSNYSTSKQVVESTTVEDGLYIPITTTIFTNTYIESGDDSDSSSSSGSDSYSDSNSDSNSDSSSDSESGSGGGGGGDDPGAEYLIATPNTLLFDKCKERGGSTLSLPVDIFGKNLGAPVNISVGDGSEYFSASPNQLMINRYGRVNDTIAVTFDDTSVPRNQSVIGNVLVSSGTRQATISLFGISWPPQLNFFGDFEFCVPRSDPDDPPTELPSQTKTLNIVGSCLSTSQLNLTISPDEVFSIDKDSIGVSDGSVDNTVKITFTPTYDTPSADGKLEISVPGAVNVKPLRTITLYGRTSSEDEPCDEEQSSSSSSQSTSTSQIKEPTLTVTPNDLEFCVTDGTKKRTKKVHIHGENLPGRRVYLDLTDNYGNVFRVSRSELTPDENGNVDKDVSIEFSPESSTVSSEIFEWDGTLSVYSSKVGSQNVSLFGHVSDECADEPSDSDSESPILEVYPSSISFCATDVSQIKHKSIRIYGEHLKGKINLSISNPEVFSISKSEITPEEGRVNELVSIMFTPKNAASGTITLWNKTLTVSSPQAASQTVSISGQILETCADEPSDSSCSIELLDCDTEDFCWKLIDASFTPAANSWCNHNVSNLISTGKCSKQSPESQVGSYANAAKLVIYGDSGSIPPNCPQPEGVSCCTPRTQNCNCHCCCSGSKAIAFGTREGPNIDADGKVTYSFSGDPCAEQGGSGYTWRATFTFDRCEPDDNSRHRVSRTRQKYWRISSYSRSKVEDSNIEVLGEEYILNSPPLLASPLFQTSMILSNVFAHDTVTEEDYTFEFLSSEWTKDGGQEATQLDADSCMIQYSIINQNNDVLEICTFTFTKS